MMRPGCSASTMALRIFATPSGSRTAPSVFTRMPRSAPMASAVRMVSAACCGPPETQPISVALPASLRRIASSTAISSNGFIDILTLPSSTPEPSALTRIFTSLSTARLTGTRIFMALKDLAGDGGFSCCSAAFRRFQHERQLLRCGNLPAAAAAVNVSAYARAFGRNRARLRAFEQPNPRWSHDHEQDGARDQTADMRPIGDAVVGSTCRIDELPDRPAADDPIGPQPQRNKAEEAGDLGARPAQQIRGYHARDGAGRADQSGRRARIASHESKARADTAGQI